MSRREQGTAGDHHHQLVRGIMWLGSASIVSKLVDAVSLVVVLGFLSREELGLATLAWSVTTFLESLNGFGINAPLIQRPTLSDDQRAGAHWYAIMVALALSAIVWLGAPLFAEFYDAPELTLMTRVASTKLVFVGAANVPLALLSRDMRFGFLGAISGAATLLSSALAIGLAAAGAGAWAPLLANTAHGAFQLLGVCTLAPFFPKPKLAWSRLRPLLGEGFNVAMGSALGQVTRNLDYLVVGQIAGLDTLGTYRVAFDLAMAPTVAILQVMSRSAFPIYSRLASDLAALTRSFSWTVRSTSFLILAPLLFVAFEGEVLFELLGKSSQRHTTTILACLCAAAFLRAASQPFSQVLVATGNARRALLEASSSCLLIAASLGLWVSYGVTLPITVRVAFAWLCAYVIQLCMDVVLTRHVVPGLALGLARGLRTPLTLAVLTVPVMLAVNYLLPLEHTVWRIVIHGSLLIVVYLGGLHVLGGVRLFGSRWIQFREPEG